MTQWSNLIAEIVDFYSILCFFMTMAWYEGNFYGTISGQCCLILIELVLTWFFLLLIPQWYFLDWFKFKLLFFYTFAILIKTFVISFKIQFFSSLPYHKQQSNLFYQICNFYSHSHINLLRLIDQRLTKFLHRLNDRWEWGKRRKKITGICLLVIVGNNKKRDCFLCLADEWRNDLRLMKRKKRWTAFDKVLLWVKRMRRGCIRA